MLRSNLSLLALLWVTGCGAPESSGGLGQGRRQEALETARPSSFVALTPVVVADTASSDDPLAAQETRVLSVAGVGAIPDRGVEAVHVVLTISNAASAGHVVLWNADTEQPLTSTLNLAPGASVSNTAIVRLGSSGKVALRNVSGGFADFRLDVVGYYAANASPARLIPHQSTPVVVTVNRNQTVTVPATAAGGQLEGTGALSVFASLRVQNARGSGHVEAGGVPLLHHEGGNEVNAFQSIALPVGGKGNIRFTNVAEGRIELVIYWTGYWTPELEETGAGKFVPVPPERILDTRTELGGHPGAGGNFFLKVTDSGAIPSDGVAFVAVNVTAVSTARDGGVMVQGGHRDSWGSVEVALGLAADASFGVVGLFQGKGYPHDTVSVAALPDTHAMLDVVGYFTER